MLIAGCFYDPTGATYQGSGTSTGGATSVGDSGSSEDASATALGSTGATSTGGTGNVNTASTGTGVGTSDLDTGATGAARDDCGDYVVETGEACDQGPMGGPDCTAQCEPSACGDGIQTFGEQCDDGNLLDNDICVGCKTAYCGDGAVHSNVESCDDAGESADCNADCSVAQCGDKKVNAASGEACDLGASNGLYGSGCAADCKGVGPFCGDGVLNIPDEDCDVEIALPNAVCIENCQKIQCDQGRGNCDKDFKNGCEVNLSTDENNCGICAKSCNVFTCIDGECKP